MSFSDFDRACMARALELAERGLYTTRPNPRVGCVLARDGRIVGEGFHERAGLPHAEIAALREAGPAARGSSAYVTLEPCSHHGRTPPCADALISAGVKHVTFAIQDPHPVVNGSGHERLRRSGIEVRCGLMAAQAEALNCGFLKRMQAGRPWIRVKVATSLDGRSALPNGVSQWISSEASRRDAQHWRARSCAILTGIGTVLADDPRLTVRLDEPHLRPLRVVVDTHWRTPPGSRVLDHPESAVLVGSAETRPPGPLMATGVRLAALPAREGRMDLCAVIQLLGEMELNEVQVEAGAVLCGGLLRAGLVDEVLWYLAPVLLGEGGPGPFALGRLEALADGTHLELEESVRIGPDLRLRLRAPDRAARASGG